MSRRSLFLVAALSAAALIVPAAEAQTTQRIGSDLGRPANLSFGCELRPNAGAFGGFVVTGTTTCTWWPAPLTLASTYVPRGTGRVTRARIRSGASPAPLRITILSSGSGLCCTSRSQSAVFQPQPNQVTEVPLDLPAGSGLDPSREGGQFNDIVAVSAVGLGSLPVHDTGVHGTYQPEPSASFLHPELPVGASNTDVGWMDGYEVLLQYDWCGVPGTGASNARIAQACGGGGGPAPANPIAQTPSAGPLRRLGGAVRVRRGRARLRLQCLIITACRGSVVLRRRGKLLGRAKLKVPAGETKTIRIPLKAAVRGRLKSGEKLKAKATVKLADGSKLEFAVTLKR